MSKIRKPFGPYLVQKVIIRTLLVIGIVVFGGMSVDRLRWRKDLTEDQRYTISEASHRFAAALDDQLTIKAYFTEKDLSAQIVPLYEQVMDVLEEYETASNGKIKLERYDPSESTAAKNAAEGYGIRPVKLMLWEQTARKTFNAWGSIVLIYQDKQSQVLNIASRYPDGYEGLSGLEYEISSRIWQLDNDKPTLGITGYLASTPRPNPRNPMGGRPQPEFTLVRRVLGDAFRIDDVDLNQVEPDPAKIPCLLVVRPKEFNDVQKFRLDQYLMKGGRLIFFVTQGELAAGMMGSGMQLRPFKTGLDDWFAFQGVRIPPEIVMHASSALPQQVRQNIGGGLVSVVDVPNPFRPVISRTMENCISKDNPAVQPLRQIPFYYPHPVELLEGKLTPEVNATVLVRSDERQSWRWKKLQTVGLEEAIRDIRSGQGAPTSFYSSNLIIALDGQFKSFYADKPVPPSIAGAEDEDDANDGEKKKAPEVIKQSVKTTVVVVGSAFSISDGALMDPRSRGVSATGREIAQVAFNLVDWLARAPELIKMRQKSFAKRELVNEVEATVTELDEEFQSGKITREEFLQRYNEAQDKQKADQKRWIWINILVPGLFVLVLGLIVWIVRVGRRSTVTSIPKAVPPGAPASRETASKETA